jgi:dephospho-CoA kinase
MIKIGLSGTRLSGKDKVAKLFKSIGVPIFDTDLVIRFILAHEYKLIEKIRKIIGNDYFRGDVLNIDKVSRDGIFNNIVSIIEPVIFEAYYKFENKNKGYVYTVFNSSILFERKWNKKMDYNISVYSPIIYRVERAKKINEKGFESVSKIKNVLNKEMDELVKNSLSDYIIHNYNEINIKRQIDNIDQKIIDLYLKEEYKKQF